MRGTSTPRESEGICASVCVCVYAHMLEPFRVSYEQKMCMCLLIFCDSYCGLYLL